MSIEQPLAIEIDLRLMEEAVSLVLHGRRSAPYWSAREKVYAIADTEEREAAFTRLGREEFTALKLDEPVRRALAEQPDIEASLSCCRLAPARSRKEEGAELFVAREGAGRAGGSTRWVVIRLGARAFLDPERLLALLRHELCHIADMLDPRFGYDPALPEVEGGPAELHLVLSRYRVLWDTVIDGRLARLGRSPVGTRELRRREFATAFPMLGARWEEQFDRWFHDGSPAHAALLDLARDPARRAGSAPGVSSTRGICPLCRCPGRVDDASCLPGSTLAELRRDFPAWHEADGTCAQCADLYRSRGLSSEAAAVLPHSAALGTSSG